VEPEPPKHALSERENKIGQFRSFNTILAQGPQIRSESENTASLSPALLRANEVIDTAPRFPFLQILPPQQPPPQADKFSLEELEVDTKSLLLYPPIPLGSDCPGEFSTKSFGAARRSIEASSTNPRPGRASSTGSSLRCVAPSYATVRCH
jgi:hypothetical protein